MSTPIYVNLYWDVTWDADNLTMPKDALDDFTVALIRSSYFKGLGEYGVGSPSYGGGYLPHGNCAPKAPDSVGFYETFGPSIIGFLQCELDNDSNLPRGSQVVYNIILPSGSLESDAYGLDKFCNGGGANAWHFHDTPYSFAAEAAIALIASLNPGWVLTGVTVLGVIATLHEGPLYTITSADRRCGNLISNLVHEMVEATTDPFPPLSVIVNGGTGEIVDLCDNANAPALTPFVPLIPVLPTKTEFPSSRKFTSSSIISVPSYWSNATQTCVSVSGDMPTGSIVAGGTLPRPSALLFNNLPFQVSTSGNGATISFTISGKGFGVLPTEISLPTSANLPYFAIQNNTQGWQAGNSLNGDSVNLTFTSWSDTAITATGLGFSSGNNLVMKPNDNFTVWVCNPSSTKCGTGSWALQEAGTPELNLLIINSVPLHFNVAIDGNIVATHTGGGFTGWQSLTAGNHLITELATDPGLFTAHFFGGCEAGKITLHNGDNQFCTLLNGFNTGCASGQHCCGSVGTFGCMPECVSNTVTCNPLCPQNAQGLNKCCEGPLATGECSSACIKSPPQSCH